MDTNSKANKNAAPEFLSEISRQLEKIVGKACVTVAFSRLKFIGGERAHYTVETN